MKLMNFIQVTFELMANEYFPRSNDKFSIEILDGSQDFKDVRNQLIMEHSLLFIIGFVVFVLACCIFKDQPTVSRVLNELEF